MQPQPDDEFYIEAAEMEPQVRRSYFSRLLNPLSVGQRALGRRKLRSFIVVSVLIALVALLALFSPIQQLLISTLRPELHSRTTNLPSISMATPIPTPTELLYSTPTLAQSELLAPVPECPPGPQPQVIAPQYFGAAIGDTPVWVVGFAGPHATIRIDTRNIQYTRYGWAARVIFVVKPGYTSPIMISGQNMEDSGPLWLQADAPMPQVSLYLDPNYPEVPSPENYGGWAQWPTYLFIPKAGCYGLQARWPGGSWTVDFAAGS
jgi:hypothetical protein